MSSSDAQRSPVHQSTEDSGLEPTGPAGAAAPGRSGPRGGPADNPSGNVARDAADLKNRPDNAMGVPGNFERGAAMAGRVPDSDDNVTAPGAPTAGPGAGDGSSGGGAGAGIPGGGTDMRTGGAFNAGNPDEDRQRLFPDAAGNRPRPFNDETKIGTDPDESSYGGPLNLDDPKAV